MVELWIEDKQVDLIGDESISIDYAICKIGEIQSRTGARSASYKLKKTAVNRGIFENPDDVNSLSQIPYRKLKARLYVDGIDQQIRFCILESSIDNYNIRLYGENSELFELLKNTTLQELNFCQYDHFWTIDNVVDTRTNTDGFVYPVCDWNYDSPNTIMDNSHRRINVSNMLPAVYVHSVFDAIGNYFGVTINNEVEQIANYPLNKLLLPFSRKKYTRVRTPYRYETSFSATNDVPCDDVVPGIGTSPSPGVYVEFDTHNGCSDYWNHGNFDDFLQFGEKVRCTIEYNLTFETTLMVDVVSSMFITSEYTKTYNVTGIPNIDWKEIVLSVPNGGSVTVSGEFTFETSSTDVYFPDALQIWIANTTGIFILKAGSSIRLKDVEILEDRDIIYSSTEQVNNFVTIGSVLPEWTCGKFIKEYCLLFNAAIVYDSLNKSINIFPFKKIKDNISNAIDWSDKVDFQIEHEIYSYIEGYAQSNNFQYSDEEEVVKPIGTDYTFQIDNQTLINETNLVTSSFVATSTVVRLVDITIPQIKVFDQDGDTIKGVEKQRILVNKYYDTADFANTAYLQYTDGTGSHNVTTDLPIPYFISSGESFNLGFENNIVGSYYDVLFEILSNAKRCIIPIRLNASDINKLDFTRPVYIKHYNSYFYISQIAGHVPTNNESTTVELVKLF